jgi:hypothetical protein
MKRPYKAPSGEIIVIDESRQHSSGVVSSDIGYRIGTHGSPEVSYRKVQRIACPHPATPDEISGYNQELDMYPEVAVAAALLGTRGGAATKGISTPAKRRAARRNAKLGGRPKSDVTYSIRIIHEDRPDDGQPLSARTDRSAIREFVRLLPQVRAAHSGAQIYLAWFRASDACRGYLNRGEGASPTGKPW